jgi:hypothetical protein
MTDLETKQFAALKLLYKAHSDLWDCEAEFLAHGLHESACARCYEHVDRAFKQAMEILEPQRHEELFSIPIELRYER